MVKKTKIAKSNTTITRPPIVAVLGHVDHGKTTLLDTIRKTTIASGEAGGITQKIGAYQLDSPHKITFIDTPGHAAFAKMRSRGAKVADIALLIVAANDGVMPQTLESIKFIKEAGIPMIVVINKIDLAEADPKKVMEQLARNDVLVEKLGGKVVVTQISAKNQKGITELLDLIWLLWEMQEVKTDLQSKLSGIVIETRMDKKRGILATVIIKSGILRLGQTIFAENIQAKVKQMFDDRGKSLNQAVPSMPVEIMGWEKIPAVGQEIHSDKQVNTQEIPQRLANYDLSLIPVEQNQKLKLILKTDNFGSLEAISEKLPEHTDIVSQSVGDITESDVLLAKSTGAIIIGFNLKPNASVTNLAASEHVKLKNYTIIYELLDEITEVVNLLNQPQAREDILGEAQILAEFRSDKDKVAGCKVLSGRLSRGDKAKIMRKTEEIGRSKIKTIRQGKNDVPKSEVGTECGVVMDKKLDFRPGDSIISYRVHELLA